MDQVRRNPQEQVLHGDFPRAVENAVLDSMNSHNEIAGEVLRDEDTAKKFVRLLLRELVREMGQEQSQQ